MKRVVRKSYSKKLFLTVLIFLLFAIFYLVFLSEKMRFSPEKEESVGLIGYLDLETNYDTEKGRENYEYFFVSEDGKKYKLKFLNAPRDELIPSEIVSIAGILREDTIYASQINYIQNARPIQSNNILGEIEVPEYENYFLNNPAVSGITINRFDSETLSYFWGYITELESSGVLTIEEPIESQNCVEPEVCALIYLTSEEKKRIIAAKAAHSIWLDKNNMLPWHLSDYNTEELKGLFDEYEIFRNGDHFYSVVDYSPSQVYSYLLGKNLIQSDVESTVYAVLDDLRTDFRHGIIDRDPTDTAYTLYDALTEYGEDDNQRVSRVGCHTMTRISNSLLRGVNIPGLVRGNWFGGHSSAEWPYLKKVLVHGDDFYNKWLTDTPNEKLLMSYYEFEQNRPTLPCKSYASEVELSACISSRHNIFNFVRYPTSEFLEKCINYSYYGYGSCWEILEGYCLSSGNCLTAEEEEEAEDCVFVDDCKCGNSVLELGEFCDDGNELDGGGYENGDWCRNDCVFYENECSNNVDDDNDLEKDFPNDFSCTWADDSDEENILSQCQDGIDNNLDGLTDYPQDLACDSYQDNKEMVVCGDGVIDVFEECDDGNIIDGDGCSLNCQIDFGWECWGEPSSCVSPEGEICPIPGLVLYHKYNSGAQDYSGRGHNGAPNEPVLTPGVYGNAYNFDGINDYIGIGEHYDFDTALDSITISVWVYPKEYSAPLSSIIGKWARFGTTNRAYHLYLIGGPWIYFDIAESSGGSGSIYSYVPMNEWNHIAATWNGSDMKLYVNGVLAANAPLIGDRVYDSSSGLAVGRINSIENYYYFNGSIDEFTLWNRSLSEEEIQSLMFPLACGVELCTDGFDNDEDNLIDCSDNDCNEQYCDAQQYSTCSFGNCVDSCVGTNHVCDADGVCDSMPYAIGDAQCARDSPGAVCCERTASSNCNDVGGICIPYDCGEMSLMESGDECNDISQPGEYCCSLNFCFGEGMIGSTFEPISCCDGLTALPTKDLQMNVFVCTANCGNGVCDSVIESKLNCPEDCRNTVSKKGAGIGEISPAKDISSIEPNGEIRLSPVERFWNWAKGLFA